MTAVKVAAFGKGVNVTLGLPFPRTAPDHGTALDIAGQGVADPSSMRAALELAVELAGRARPPPATRPGGRRPNLAKGRLTPGDAPGVGPDSTGTASRRVSSC